MRRTFIGICCLILCVLLVACGNRFPNFLGSNYRNFTANGDGDKYEMSGKSQVVDTLHLVYISALEDTCVDLSGELKSISGNVQIVYINSDNKETIISDSSTDSQNGNLKLSTTVNLEKGESFIEFRGKESTFQFDLLFANIDQSKVKYFSADAEEDEETNEEVFEDWEEESLKSEEENLYHEDEDNLLEEVSVSYTDKDENCTILETSLDKDTKIKLLIGANVFNIEDKDNLSFGGFYLEYKTEDDSNIKILQYKTNEFAIGGYEWQDSFVQEIDLPKGANELIFNSYEGKNYEIKLNVKVYAVDNS